MNTSSGCAITPQDFSSSTSDVLRDRWTVGKMRHVVAALAGRPVAITTDRMTGSTRIGVTLRDVQGLRHGTGYGVVVESTFEDGTTSGTLFDLHSLGVIIPLDYGVGEKDAKWTALETYRQESSEAIRQARETHPELGYGRWNGTPCFDCVSVTYEPQGGEREAHRSGSRWHGRVCV